jgi:hypothetical protein
MRISANLGATWRIPAVIRGSQRFSKMRLGVRWQDRHCYVAMRGTYSPRLDEEAATLLCVPSLYAGGPGVIRQRRGASGGLCHQHRVSDAFVCRAIHPYSRNETNRPDSAVFSSLQTVRHDLTRYAKTRQKKTRPDIIRHAACAPCPLVTKRRLVSPHSQAGALGSKKRACLVSSGPWATPQPAHRNVDRDARFV